MKSIPLYLRWFIPESKSKRIVEIDLDLPQLS